MSAFSLRLPDDLMRQAREIAERNDTSLNQFFLAAIAERVGAEKAERLFRDLASRADPEAFRKILDRVPDVPPLPGDEFDG